MQIAGSTCSSTVRKMAKYRKYNKEVRKTLVEAALNEGDWHTIARTFHIPLSTARGWIRKAQLNGNLFVDNRPRGRTYQVKVTVAMEEWMVKAVEENPQITLKEIAFIIFREFTVTVSTSTVARHLDGKCYSLKKVYHYSEKMNSMINKEKRRIYLQALLNFRDKNKNIIYIDESNLNLFLRRTQARSKTGTRAHINLPCTKGPNVHMVAGISRTGLHHFRKKRGSYNLEGANQWFEGLIEECVSKGIPRETIVVVCDNAPVHKRLDDTAKECGVDLLRLGPYSPFLNPIETMWSFLKSEIKKVLPRKLCEDPDPPPQTTKKEHRLRLLEASINESLHVITETKILRAMDHITN